MPAMTSVVLTDRATPTPVAHTYVPVNVSSAGVAEFRESSGVLLGANTISISHKSAGSKQQGDVRYVFNKMGTETLNGVARPVLLDTATVFLKTSFTDKSDQAFRDYVLAVVQRSLDTTGSIIYDVLVDQEPVY